MLARETRDFFVPAKSAANAMNFVRRHRFAVARPAENNPAFALAASADMRLALALLLRRTTCRLFVLGAAKIAPVAPLAFVFGAAGFL